MSFFSIVPTPFHQEKEKKTGNQVKDDDVTFYPTHPSDQAFLRMARQSCITETILPSGHKMPKGLVNPDGTCYDWIVDKSGNFASLVPTPFHVQTSGTTHRLWKRLVEAKSPKDISLALSQLEDAGLVKPEHKDNLIGIVRDAREHFGEEEWKAIWTSECKEAFRSLLSFE